MRNALVLGAAVAAAALPTAAFAEKGDILVRARAIVVAPSGDASNIEPSFQNSSVDVQTDAVPEVDFTYFFTDRIAAELILATSRHDIEATGDIAGLGRVADAGVLPPTLTLQYHFMPDATFRPYVGVGINYTLFYDEDTTASLNNAIGETSVDLDNSFGFALQVGADYAIDDNWFFNVDVKYIRMNTEATLRTGDLVNTIDVDIHPFVYGLGIGRRF